MSKQPCNATPWNNNILYTYILYKTPKCPKEYAVAGSHGSWMDAQLIPSNRAKKIKKKRVGGGGG